MDVIELSDVETYDADSFFDHTQVEVSFKHCLKL